MTGGAAARLADSQLPFRSVDRLSQVTAMSLEGGFPACTGSDVSVAAMHCSDVDAVSSGARACRHVNVVAVCG